MAEENKFDSGTRRFPPKPVETIDEIVQRHIGEAALRRHVQRVERLRLAGLNIGRTSGRNYGSRPDRTDTQRDLANRIVGGYREVEE